MSEEGAERISKDLSEKFFDEEESKDLRNLVSYLLILD
jgi:hypothetical protein